jgi:integrase
MTSSAKKMRPTAAGSAPRRTPEQAREDERLSFGDTGRARNHAPELSRAVGSFARQTGAVAAILTGCGHSTLPLEAQEAMTTYKPRRDTETWPKIAEFVKDACSVAAPQTAYSAKLLITIATAFVTWCVVERGLPLQADVVFSRQVIDVYATEEDRGRSEGTRRNYRAMLTRIAEVLVPEEHGTPMTPLSRKGVREPYSDKEMKAFRFWALGQRTPIKERRAMLMLIFCAGAALKPVEIIDVAPEDVLIDGNGILINVRGGTNPRQVPLLQEWEDWLTAILEDVDPGVPLWGPPNRSDGGNLLSSFTQYTIGNYPRGDRLRATWIVRQLQANAPIKELYRALGFNKFENLPRYLAYVTPLDEDSYRSALRQDGDTK